AHLCESTEVGWDPALRSPRGGIGADKAVSRVAITLQRTARRAGPRAAAPDANEMAVVGADPRSVPDGARRRRRISVMPNHAKARSAEETRAGFIQSSTFLEFRRCAARSRALMRATWAGAVAVRRALPEKRLQSYIRPFEGYFRRKPQKGKVTKKVT